MRGSWLVPTAAAALMACFGTPAMAQDPGADVDMGPAAAGELMPVMVHLGDLLIEDPWTRATPPGAPTAAGYLSITNNGSTPDTLIGASAGLAGQVEVHRMTMEADVMVMRPLPGGVEIAPGEKVTLAPGGYHLMMMGLERAIALDDVVPVTLEFEKAGTIEIDFRATVAGGGNPYSMGMGGSHEPDDMDNMGDGM